MDADVAPGRHAAPSGGLQFEWIAEFVDGICPHPAGAALQQPKALPHLILAGRVLYGQFGVVIRGHSADSSGIAQRAQARIRPPDSRRSARVDTGRRLRALSIRQPWAELILSGRKGYELRSRRTSMRGRIWIHASKSVDRAAAMRAGLDGEMLVAGVLIGTVEIVDCVPFTRAIASELRRTGGYFGDANVSGYAWRLANPQRLPLPIPMRGMLGFFAVPDSIVPDTTL